MFEAIREWVTFAADVCILLITIYTFVITFVSKKIKVLAFSESHSIKNGNNFSVVIENRSLSPQVIESIYMIYENTYKIELKKFDVPLILESFKALKVQSDNFSFTAPSLPTLMATKITFEITTSRKRIYLRFNKKTDKVTPDMKKIHYNVTKVINTYNGKIIPQGAKFALNVSKEDWNETVFVFSSGMMTDEILGVNAIPVKVVQEKESLTNFLDNWLKPIGIEYYIDMSLRDLSAQ